MWGYGVALLVPAEASLPSEGSRHRTVKYRIYTGYEETVQRKAERKRQQWSRGQK